MDPLTNLTLIVIVPANQVTFLNRINGDNLASQIHLSSTVSVDAVPSVKVVLQ